ncbi:TPA: acyl-CoA synthetase [bacterium]|nr:acyl-CoA synthetase [bacterium]
MNKFFSPKSVAVVGASHGKGKVGYEIFSNLILSGFSGEIYPINPKGGEILGIKCLTTILDCPKTPELAIIVVKNILVPQALEELGKIGTKNAIIISSGFKEIGIEGLELENKCLRIAKENNIRVIGPNCLGLIDTKTPLNASFAKQFPEKGKIAFISQSGALCTAILDWARKENIGFSKMISFGNKMDISEIELIEFLLDDYDTSVISLYLEGTKDGKRFVDVCQRAKKPIILYKAGKTEAGKRAISCHTGSLAGSEKTWKAVIEQVGIISAQSIDELFLLATGFANQMSPSGKKVAVITNAGGPGIIASDSLMARGIQLSYLSKETVMKLKKALPPSASFYNPVDVLGDSLSDRYEFALKTVIDDQGVDGIILILTPQAMTEIEKTARIVVENQKKAVFPVFMGGKEIEPAVSLFREYGMLNYSFPERAVCVLERMVNQKMPHFHKDFLEFSPDKERVARIFLRVQEEGRKELSEIEAYEVLEAYGVPFPETHFIRETSKLYEIENTLKYPVVLKIASPDILHKTDIGCVKFPINSPSELRKAYIDVICNAKEFAQGSRILGAVIQKMLSPSKELIIGLNKDPQFGHLLMVGLGGLYVEVLKDVAFRLLPICPDCAMDMLKELKSYPLLLGVRGEIGIDFNSVISAMEKVSKLAIDFPEIIQLDINPLKAYNNGCFVVDCKIIIE